MAFKFGEGQKRFISPDRPERFSNERSERSPLGGKRPRWMESKVVVFFFFWGGETSVKMVF